jgi:nucleoid-associated protein YgaU
MRNDVKLGFAIGGVLLAVVIVFALVNSSSPDPGTDTSTAQVESPVSPVDATRQASGGTPAATTSSTPTNSTAAGTTSAGNVSATPTDVFANNGATPSNGQPFDWREGLATGKLPTMMNHQATPSGSSGTPTGSEVVTGGSNSAKTDSAAARKPITVPSTTTETNNDATSNTPAVLGGGVNERSANSARVNVAGSSSQPDADKVLSDYKSTAAKTGTTTETRAAGTSLSTPTKTILTTRTHTIKSGETFSTIATAYYGHIRHAKLIAKANPGVDSSRLKIGQVINLPAYDAGAEAAAITKANTPTAIDSARQYRVQSGDSLHNIAMKLYNDPKKVEAIYAANKAVIGENPAKLKLGMVLTLPAQPAVAKK